MDDASRLKTVFIFACLALAILASACGKNTADQASTGMRTEDGASGIVGGELVDEAKTPIAEAVLQMVAVEKATDSDGNTEVSKSRCTATLIGERVVLTAAHCIDNYLGKKLFPMRVDSATSQAQSDGTPVIIVGHELGHSSLSVIEIAVPKEFKRRKGGASPDIALLLLESPMKLSAEAARPKIDTTGLAKPGARLTAMGFGLTEYDPVSASRDRKPRGLFQKTLRVFESSRVNWRPESKLKDSFFLGVERRQAKGNACKGDSGGPVFSGKFAVGVISTSELGCEGHSRATAVSAHSAWIQSQAAKWKAQLY